MKDRGYYWAAVKSATYGFMYYHVVHTTLARNGLPPGPMLAISRALLEESLAFYIAERRTIAK